MSLLNFWKKQATYYKQSKRWGGTETSNHHCLRSTHHTQFSAPNLPTVNTWMVNKLQLKTRKQMEKRVSSRIFSFRKFLKRGTCAKSVCKYAHLNLKETTTHLLMKKASVRSGFHNKFFSKRSNLSQTTLKSQRRRIKERHSRLIYSKKLKVDYR